MEPVDETSSLPALRSLNNIQISFIRFINTTKRNVGVYWIDYQGQAIRYKVLSYRDHLDVNTFVTHPWIFVDEETRDRFKVNCSEVFFPEAWTTKYQGMRRQDLPSRIDRTYVYITLPLYTLRDLSMRAIKKHLRYDHHAFLLDIPRSLQYELASMPPRKNDPSEL
ncbi:von Hippel-Lindau tumor suppressor homolog [Cephus cinctus]|uniref:von Hippel-Lindau tumor suppressor homolog n=1 Tax=Cephus cinctus TaxID=211228 RepID=A0AAJ7BMX7_CEPCN|nr:von Hippel-Lindau tumor suppressor homolog [Cephus cinctus]XP_024938030.1 von Hippel-Lindau tumor suppressor homolog [Cephus cinctus]XP_024938031.1 von Hippel-Lindau tumor suppressor homolog [Cephus cinctus]